MHSDDDDDDNDNDDDGNNMKYICSNYIHLPK